MPACPSILEPSHGKEAMMRANRQATITGAYESPVRHAPDTHPFDIHADVVSKALADAGLAPDDVDGFATAAGDFAEGGAFTDLLDVVDYLGLHPTYIDSTDIGGASYIAHAARAASAIERGEAEVVVISYAAVPRWWPIASPYWDGITQPAGLGQWEIPYSPTLVSSFGLVAQRHMHEFGTKPEHLARIAVSCRESAARNPSARYRSPITIDDVLASPMIASPLHRLDCCVVTDGGGAVVMTSAERAQDCKGAPVQILGSGSALSSLRLSELPQRMVSPAATSGAAAFSRAGLTPNDVDVAQIYDAFTITVLLTLEDLGFCAKGEVGNFIESGAIDFGGPLPINTDGGGLSSNHGGRRGMYALIEGVRQLRGTSPGQSVANCEVALVHGIGGIFSAGVTLLLGKGR